MTTEQLVRAAQSGDDEAFFLLVSGEKERLYRIAFAYLRSESDALEALQEATCRAYAKLRKLKEPQYFHTWLIRILIHYCIDEQKRMSKASSLPIEASPNKDPHATLDDRLELEAAIERLNPQQQHIIILKYYHDMTLTEIARLLKKPEGTIKTWLNKALTQLRAHIGREGGGDFVQPNFLGRKA
ncbi:sigma-70 family RNA polymerase sigma factor [Cohnella luojiensis]|uniref:Sigma-70 family RNA polymerase sigma factor n=1 Tax=Cohnella luojiensis TaxID=652876 RepID=A0A4Y8LSA6_9BACL|nr:sigma-70 family RNA polymerase sigma factor [Cohnella luojiensis]TFE19422.1 sigma-70 family RNA polymerase sigma factor [Cohnella luojiensis]